MNLGELYSPHLGRPLKVYLAGASDLHTPACPLIWSFLRGPLSQLFDLSGDVIFIDDDELTTQIKRQTAENQGAVSSHSGLLHYSVFLLWNIYFFLFSDFLFECLFLKPPTYWEFFLRTVGFSWCFFVMEVYVCIPHFQASMMSAENDPLGPLPPGWGEFTYFLPNPMSTFHKIYFQTKNLCFNVNHERTSQRSQTTACWTDCCVYSTSQQLRW